MPKNEKILNQLNEAFFYMGRVEFVVFIAFNFEDAFLYHYQKFSELSPFLMFMFTHVLEKMSIQEQDKIERERFKSFLLGAIV